MARRKGTLIKRILITSVILTVWLMGCAVQVGAETVNFRSTLYFMQFEVIPVGDVEGHIIAIGFRRGLTFFENGEVAAYTPADGLHAPNET